MLDRKIAILTSTALVAIFAASAHRAHAADIALKAPPPSPLTWQGIYVGGSVGGAGLNSVQDDQEAVSGVTSTSIGGSSSSTSGGGSSTARSLGFIGGLNAGFNVQTGRLVYGLEGDFSWLGNLTASSTGRFINSTSSSFDSDSLRVNPGTTSRSSRVDELATLRGRFGFDFDGTLSYLTAGVAWGRTSNSFTITGAGYNGTVTSASATVRSWVPGIVLGGGMEHRLTRNWTLRGEMMWIGFANQQIANPLFDTNPQNLTSNGLPVKFSNDLVIGRVGVNYNF